MWSVTLPSPESGFNSPATEDSFRHPSQGFSAPSLASVNHFHLSFLEFKQPLPHSARGSDQLIVPGKTMWFPVSRNQPPISHHSSRSGDGHYFIDFFFLLQTARPVWWFSSFSCLPSPACTSSRDLASSFFLLPVVGFPFYDPTRLDRNLRASLQTQEFLTHYNSIKYLVHWIESPTQDGF